MSRTPAEAANRPETTASHRKDHIPSRSETHIVVTGDGNSIASTNPSGDTVTINGRTYEIPKDGPLVVDGNTISTTRTT